MNGRQRAAAVLAIASNRLEEIEGLSGSEAVTVGWVVRAMRYAGMDLTGEIAVSVDEVNEYLDSDDEEDDDGEDT